MNREELERQLLLAESGELDAASLRALEDWLTAHPEDKALRVETRFLLTSARVALPSPDPGADVRAGIRAAAERELAQPAFVFPAVWLRGLAYAAALALAVGAWIWRAPAPSATGHGDRIAQVHALVSLAHDEDHTPTTAPADDREEQLRALARDLLSMEGLALDDGTETAEDDTWEEGVTPAAEPVPTVLQPRSTAGLAARTYG